MQNRDARLPLGFKPFVVSRIFHERKKITPSFEVLSAIIAVTVLQAFASTAGMAATQCAKPMLTPPWSSSPVQTVTVTITTATTGAYLRYTLNGSTPTGGPSVHGTLIAKASGKVGV